MARAALDHLMLNYPDPMTDTLDRLNLQTDHCAPA